MSQAPNSEAVLAKGERWVRSNVLRETCCLGLMSTGIIAVLGESLSHVLPVVSHVMVWSSAVSVGVAIGLRSWFAAKRAGRMASCTHGVYSTGVVDLLRTATLANGRLADLVISQAESQARSFLSQPLPKAPRPAWFRESLAIIVLAALVATIPHTSNTGSNRSTARIQDIAAMVARAEAGTFGQDPEVLRALDALRQPSVQAGAAKAIAKTLADAAASSDPSAALDRLRLEPEWKDELADSRSSPLNARLRDRLATLSPEARARLADALRDAAEAAPKSIATKLKDAATSLATGASGAASAADVVSELVRLHRARQEVMDIAVALRSAAGGGGPANAHLTTPGTPATTHSRGDLDEGERRELEGPDAAVVRRYFELRDVR